MGDISIDRSLYSFVIMKMKLGDHLARLLAFAWRLYKRNKARKEEEEKKRKAKAKSKKKKKGGRGASF